MEFMNTLELIVGGVVGYAIGKIGDWSIPKLKTGSVRFRDRVVYMEYARQKLAREAMEYRSELLGAANFLNTRAIALVLIGAGGISAAAFNTSLGSGRYFALAVFGSIALTGVIYYGRASTLYEIATKFRKRAEADAFEGVIKNARKEKDQD